MASLNSSQSTVLKGYASNIPNLSVDTRLADFLSMYFACHILAEKLVEYKAGKTMKVFKYTSIISAANYYRYNINSAIIEEIFSTDKKRLLGNYSCRMLRNSFIHTMSKSAKNEIETRFVDLTNYMQQWIDLFK